MSMAVGTKPQLTLALVCIVMFWIAWNLDSIVEFIYYYLTSLWNLFFSVVGVLGIGCIVFSFFWKGGLKQRLEEDVNRAMSSILKEFMKNCKGLEGILVMLLFFPIVLAVGAPLILIPVIFMTLLTEFLPVVVGTAIGIGMLGFLVGWEVLMGILIPVGYLTTVGFVGLVATAMYKEKERKETKMYKEEESARK